MERNNINFKNLKDTVLNLSKIKVHIVGDIIIDIYTRTSLIGGQVKTPTISVLYQNDDKYIGGAGIVAQHLNSAGAKIKWIGKRSVEIDGVKKLNSISHSVMADRIECGTFCVVAAISKGELKINGLDPNIITTEIKLLKKIGAKIKTYDKTILIKGPKKIKSLKFLETKEYDGFPTDLQAQFMALLCKANGRSVIQERIFENRFTHIGELKRLGAKISIIKNKALIKGNSNFEGAELMSSDLRASVALVIAAIVAKGNSIINRIYHLDRGYENIENKLRKVGVNIKRLS